MIIGLSGKKRSGKTEVAQYLSNKFNYNIYSFAAPLKKLVYSISGLTDIDKDNYEYYDGRIFNLDVLRKELKKNKYAPLTPEEIDTLKAIEYLKISDIYRNLLQYIGTDIFRSRNENHWIFKFKENLNDNDFIVEDIRFLNEYLYISNLSNSITIKIIRNNTQYDSHISELEIDKIRFKYIFKNNFDNLIDLYNSLDNFFENK